MIVLPPYKNKKGIVISNLILVFSVLLISACSPTEAEDPNKKVIQQVLELQFNGPDERFMDVLWNPTYRVVINGIEKNQEFDKYAKEVYGDYFTKSELDVFLRAYGTSYPSLAHSNGYKLSFKEVSIKKSEEAPNRYEFVAQVGYQKDGSKEKTAEVEGVILFSTKEEGKIGRFQYNNDSVLLDSLSK